MTSHSIVMICGSRTFKNGTHATPDADRTVVEASFSSDLRSRRLVRYSRSTYTSIESVAIPCVYLYFRSNAAVISHGLYQEI